MSPFHAAARQYALRGWLVFPIRPREKRPLTKHGLQDATTDLETIDTWWTRWPDANVGIATGAVSGIVVIDIDGEEGARSFRELRGDNPAPTTLTVRTGRGWHLYFAHPGIEIRNSVGLLGPGIDVRGDGGYVIAPPSVHPDGAIYVTR